MNVHFRNLDSKNPKTKKQARAVKTGSHFPFLFKLVLIAVVIFSVFVLRVSLNEKTENLNREAVRVKQKITRLEMEIENLKIQRERLSSWAHISQRNKAFNLGLRYPDPGQVKRLVIVKRKKGDSASMDPGDKNVAVSKI
jgi:cell division protein FtsL